MSPGCVGTPSSAASAASVHEKHPEVGRISPAPRPIDPEHLEPLAFARAGRRCRAASAPGRRGPAAPRSRRASCPATSEVSATSRPASAFSSVDLPTFGGPTSATSKPSRIRSATRLPASSRSIAAATCPTAPARRSIEVRRAAPRRRSRSTPRPGQRANQLRAPVRRRAATAPRPSSATACRCCAAVSAAIRSPSPSTCARSSRPLTSARRVNSPGSASRSPRCPPAPRAPTGRPPGRHAAAARPCPRR